jgi:hypothetical protein
LFTSIDLPPYLAGGNLEVHVAAQHVNVPGRHPDLLACIHASSLHAPHVERLLELPMDIYAGRLSGELRIRAFDTRTWCVREEGVREGGGCWGLVGCGLR